MPLIVNLSSTHTLLPISSGIAAFAALRDQYNPSCCHNFFTRFCSKAWVALKLQINQKSLINPYKSGQMDTDTFLTKMLEIFYFLRNPHNTLLQDDEQAKELLKDAWNSMIQFDEKDADKIRQLLQTQEKIYLISNSNPLHIHRYLELFRHYLPDALYEFPRSVPGSSLIEIGPNLFLAVSYDLQACKTATDTQEYGMTTMSILRQLMGQLDPQTTTVVSQFDKDLQEAKKLGIPAAHVHSAKDYYRTQPAIVLSAS